jgi:mannose-6-phosphate isomerase-like protein (cupin superfamily)
VPEKVARYGEALTLVEGTGDVVRPASGVGVGDVARVEPGEVIAVPVGVGRDVVGDGVLLVLVGVLLRDGDGV